MRTRFNANCPRTSYRCISSKFSADRRLADKVVVVTGASSGLGRAIALTAADHGARLILCADLKPEQVGVSEPPTHELVQRQHGDNRALFKKADVGDAGDIEACVEEAVKEGGRLDVIFYNAGVGFEEVLTHELDEAKWDQMMRVNVRSVFLGSKFALAQFLRQDMAVQGHRGWIVNTASGAGFKGIAGGVDVKTPMSRDAYENEEKKASMLAQTPWGELGNTEDVARTAVYLASEEAAWMTGVPLAIDGGYAAR